MAADEIYNQLLADPQYVLGYLRVTSRIAGPDTGEMIAHFTYIPPNLGAAAAIEITQNAPIGAVDIRNTKEIRVFFIKTHPQYPYLNAHDINEPPFPTSKNDPEQGDARLAVTAPMTGCSYLYDVTYRAQPLATHIQPYAPHGWTGVGLDQHLTHARRPRFTGRPNPARLFGRTSYSNSHSVNVISVDRGTQNGGWKFFAQHCSLGLNPVQRVDVLPGTH